VAARALGVGMPALFGDDGRFEGWGWALLYCVLSTVVTTSVYVMVETLPTPDPTQAPMAMDAAWFAGQLAPLSGALREEIGYRGVPLAMLIYLFKDRPAVVWIGALGLSFLWAMGHTHQWVWWQLRVALLTVEGLFLTWFAMRYSLEASMVAHVTHNAIGFPVGLLVWALFM